MELHGLVFRWSSTRKFLETNHSYHIEVHAEMRFHSVSQLEATQCCAMRNNSRAATQAGRQGSYRRGRFIQPTSRPKSLYLSELLGFVRLPCLLLLPEQKKVSSICANLSRLTTCLLAEPLCAILPHLLLLVPPCRLLSCLDHLPECPGR